MDLLQGSIQPYAWGDRATIAELQGRRPTGEPEAELWLGAHPVAPSRLIGAGQSLIDLMENDPVAVVGVGVWQRFGRFPYLLKVLAAAEPLSIQVHPSLSQAKAGFEREEREGPALDDPTRTYRDDNHKPELLCALTPFEAKCGFRSLAVTRALVEAMATRPSAGRRLAEYAAALDDGPSEAECLTITLDWLFGLSADSSSELAVELLAAAGELLIDIKGDTALEMYGPELRWLAELDRFHPGDVGVAVSLLLNHVVLRPGQAMFLHGGNMHAYLRGTGVELMANSDNVIRGGLTIKHVDIVELLQVVDTTTGPAPVQTPTGSVHRFDTPVPEFSLTRLAAASADYEPVGPEIVLVTEGEARLTLLDDERTLVVTQGNAALLNPADGPYRLSMDEDSLAWRAAVGDFSLSE